MIIHSKDKTMASLFWIPMKYNFQIRLHNNYQKIISWLFINLFTTTYYALISKNIIDWTSIIALGIFSFSIYFLYEWGYIYNDIKAIQKEAEPTLRLSKPELEYGNRKYHQITLVRITVFIVGLLSTYLLLPSNNTLLAIGLAATCPILFLLYNHWRSKYNAFLYFWLVISRFIPFVWLLESDNYELKTLLIILIYPLEIAIERFSMPHYRYPIIKKIIPNETAKNRFRIIYYSVTLVIVGVLLYQSMVTIELACPFLLFWIYRCLLYVKQRKHADSLS